jgi:predicted Zn-dependent protease
VDGRMKPGRMKTWGIVPADQVLHDRLQRIGTKLIPQFQRSLADDDPRKIPFLFYAVDDEDMRNFICAPRGGLIFYPRYLIERMQNEDQLAAALAMPIAVVLQRQGLGKEMREWPAVRDELSTVALYATIPYFGAFPLDIMGALPDHRIPVRIQEQVGRIAISLVADAGYDPWQAPEAFELLVARRLPNGAMSVKHTHLSEYALSILNLEYRRATTREAKHAASK